MSGDDRSFFVEQMDDTIKRIAEMIEPLQNDISQLKIETRRLDGIEADVKAIKAAIRDTNIDITDHDQRIARLESHSA